jgi:hypothetical protein
MAKKLQIIDYDLIPEEEGNLEAIGLQQSTHLRLNNRQSSSNLKVYGLSQSQKSDFGDNMTANNSKLE